MAMTCCLSSGLIGADISCYGWLREGALLVSLTAFAGCWTGTVFNAASSRQASYMIHPIPLERRGSGADLGHGHDVDLILSAEQGTWGRRLPLHTPHEHALLWTRSRLGIGIDCICQLARVALGHLQFIFFLSCSSQLAFQCSCHSYPQCLYSTPNSTTLSS